MILPVASSTVTLTGSSTFAPVGTVALISAGISASTAVVNLVPAGAVTGLPSLSVELPSLSVNVGAATTTSSPTVPSTGL